MLSIASSSHTAALVAVLAARISGSPLAITWHEVWGTTGMSILGCGAAGSAERLLALWSDHPVAVSETTRAGLVSAGVGKDVRIIPNGIDLAEIDRIRPSGSGSDLVFIGRLIREKHVDLLIRAVSLLKEGEPGIRCLIIGDGPERALLEGLVESCGVRENVLFTGFLPDSGEVIARMKSSRVFVLPSTREDSALPLWKRSPVASGGDHRSSQGMQAGNLPQEGVGGLRGSTRGISREYSQKCSPLSG